MRRRDKTQALMGRARCILRIVILIALLCTSSKLTNLAAAQLVQPQNQYSDRTVRIGVFSLFRPTELSVRPVIGSTLAVELSSYRVTLPKDAPFLIVHEVDGEVQLQLTPESQPVRGDALRAHTFDPSTDKAPRFWLEVPGKLRRQFAGSLEVRAHEQTLEAIISMPLETAVASVVQAESPPGAGVEALKAQAVAARSFLVARQTSHTNFDFCDTTHCQFLRSPPEIGSPASEAALATEGLVLTWHDQDSVQDRTLAAMYARSCGGETHTLSQIGVKSEGYPYYAVRCVYCTRHPEIWRREALAGAKLDAGPDSTFHPRTERERLDFNRIHGWGAIPSIAGRPKDSADDAEGRWITGQGVGHGVGLCQLGAAEMARRGSSFVQILAYYYPNTRLTSISSQ